MPTNHILVVGGAGFIGSHMLLLLKQMGYTVVVLDNLSKGHREAVAGAELVVGDINDGKLLKEVFDTHNFTAVMHFAALTDRAESIINPGLYYHNNVSGLLTLLQAMSDHGVKDFIFSSTADVYGEPQALRIHEKHRLHPLTPFGRSKKMCEEIIADFGATGLLNYFIFRFFNAAGADAQGRAGERHVPETHLIPNILQVALGKKEFITVNGEDFSTADGTCVRDYVHVSDICSAHLLAMKALQKGKKNMIMNLLNFCLIIFLPLN